MDGSTPSSSSATPATAPQSNASSRRRRQKTQATKDLANSLINPSAKPIPASSLWLGMTPLTHGNVEVEIDNTVADRFSSFLASHVWTYLQGHRLMTHDARGNGPVEPESVVSLLSCGLNLAFGLKLIHSTPRSQVAALDELVSFDLMTIEIPESFLQVLDVIGKTDYGDSVIRIKSQTDLAKTVFLKAVAHALESMDFRVFLGYSNEEWNRLNQLLTVRHPNMESVLFPTVDTATKIRKLGRKHLDELLQTVVQIGDDEDQLFVSPPYLKESPNIRELIRWSQQVNNVFERDRLLLAGLLQVFQVKWLKRVNDRIGDIDPAFANSDFAPVTPAQVLAAIGCYSIYQFFETEEQFRSIVARLFGYWDQYLTIVKSIFKTKDMGRNAFGHPAQLVQLMRSDLTSYEHHRLNLDLRATQPAPNARTLYCSRKLETANEILTAGAFAVSKDVHYRHAYIGYSGLPLRQFAERVAGRSDALARASTDLQQG